MQVANTIVLSKFLRGDLLNVIKCQQVFMMACLFFKKKDYDFWQLISSSVTASLLCDSSGLLLEDESSSCFLWIN